MALIPFAFPHSYRTLPPQQPAGGDVSQRKADAEGSDALRDAIQTMNCIELSQLGVTLSGGVLSLREAIFIAIKPSITAMIRKSKTKGEAQTDSPHTITTPQLIFAPRRGHLTVIKPAGRRMRDASKAAIIAPLLRSCTGSAPNPAVITATHASTRATATPTSSNVTLPAQYLVVITRPSRASQMIAKNCRLARSVGDGARARNASLRTPVVGARNDREIAVDLRGSPSTELRFGITQCLIAPV
jgi:hypothetical protein